MEKNKAVNIPRSGKLFFKTYISFAALITIFAISLGVFYMRMYDSTMIRSNTDDLKQKAINLAQKCSACFTSNDYESWFAYYQYLVDIDSLDTVTVSNSSANIPLGENFTGQYGLSEMDRDKVREMTKATIDSLYPVTGTGYSSSHDCTTIIVSAPVMGYDGECAGVLFVFMDVNAERQIVASTTSMILISAMVALIIAFAFAIPFVNALTKPISSIRSTALTLASGDYNARTDIHARDELGELAEAMDFLAGKLAQNEIDRNNAEQMRLDFFANVSHELRTPITVMRAYTESLVDGVVTDPDKIKQYYQRMNAESIAMERLVGDLLTLSKMQNPDFQIEKEPVNLKQVFNDLVRAAGTMAEEKRITIDYKICDDPCIMMGDYERLRQMFLVIIDNAIKFSDEDSIIHVKLECDSKIYASVADEGVGISKEEIPYIFDKFYRSKLRQNAKGSGLGLAIAKNICNKHNGEIKVESEKGKGTTFTFIFEPETKVRRK
jgi:signal transduction histidine kinase